MRSLKLNEINMASGASFAEDINTVASTLIVGCGVGVASACIMRASVMLLNLPTGLDTAAAAIGFVGGPAFVAARMLDTHPEYVTTLTDKFHYYFGYFD